MYNGLSDFLSSFDDNNEEKTFKNKNLEDQLNIEEQTQTNIIETKNNTKDNINKKPNTNSIDIRQNTKEVQENKTITSDKETESLNKEERKRFLEMIESTGTKREFFKVWIDTYEKSLKSAKNNKTVNKIRKGRFRIKNDGYLELLPDLKTETLNIKEIFKSNWT